MQKQRLIVLVLGVTVGIAAVVMLNIYMQRQAQVVKESYRRKYESEKSNQSAVLIAKKDIPRGAIVEADAVEVGIVPNQFVQPQAATNLDRVAGMMTVASISKGEQVTLSKLMASQRAQGESLAMSTPAGKRAISIAVDNIASLVGMIRPGDYVDVIATIPSPYVGTDGKQAVEAVVVPLFQNVLILAVGRELGNFSVPPKKSRYSQQQAAERQDAAPAITLALSPQEASLLAFVQEQGKIRLVLRSPTDSTVQQVVPARWETLFQYLAPKETKEALEAAAKQKSSPGMEDNQPVGYIEIYRGTAKEKIPVFK